MTPAELCKSGSEHGQQRALFAWCKMAEQYGFAAAWDERSYSNITAADEYHAHPVPELTWYHAIPNGGSRGDDAKSRAIRGGQLKAEGVKSGMLDTFLPLPMWAVTNVNTFAITYCGLYIEMKRAKSSGRAKGSTFDKQDEAIAYLRRNSYAVSICFTWDQAAKELQTYIEACRSVKTT